jgi:hypothetical protein
MLAQGVKAVGVQPACGSQPAPLPEHQMPQRLHMVQIGLAPGKTRPISPPRQSLHRHPLHSGVGNPNAAP